MSIESPTKSYSENGKRNIMNINHGGLNISWLKTPNDVTLITVSYWEYRWLPLSTSYKGNDKT